MGRSEIQGSLAIWPALSHFAEIGRDKTKRKEVIRKEHIVAEKESYVGVNMCKWEQRTLFRSWRSSGQRPRIQLVTGVPI